MESIHTISGTRIAGIWTVVVTTTIGAVVRGQGTTFSEALGRALGRVPSC